MYVGLLEIVSLKLITKAIPTSKARFYIFIQALNIAQEDNKKFFAILACGFVFASSLVTTLGKVGMMNNQVGRQVSSNQVGGQVGEGEHNKLFWVDSQASGGEIVG